MGHRQDFWEPIRKYILVRLGIVTQFLEDITGSPYYTTSETHNNQFVGRVSMREEVFEEFLHDAGFDRNPISSYKHLESDPDNYEEGSWRNTSLADDGRQLHLIFYNGNNIKHAENDHVYIYAHTEYRWDEHPVKHYWGAEINGQEGVRLVKDILDQQGVTYDLIRP